MIIVLTCLGLTTNDINSTLDPDGFKAPISFITVGENTTSISLCEACSMHGTDTMYTSTAKPNDNCPIHPDDMGSNFFEAR